MKREKLLRPQNISNKAKLPSVIHGQSNIFLLSEKDKKHIRIIKKIPFNNYFNTTTNTSINLQSLTERSKSRNRTITTCDNINQFKSSRDNFNTTIPVFQDLPIKPLLESYLHNTNNMKGSKKSIWYFPNTYDSHGHGHGGNKIPHQLLLKNHSLMKKQNNASKTIKNSSTSEQSSLEKQWEKRKSSDYRRDNELSRLTVNHYNIKKSDEQLLILNKEERDIITSSKQVNHNLFDGNFKKAFYVNNTLDSKDDNHLTNFQPFDEENNKKMRLRSRPQTSRNTLKTSLLDLASYDCHQNDDYYNESLGKFSNKCLNPLIENRPNQSTEHYQNIRHVLLNNSKRESLNDQNDKYKNDNISKHSIKITNYKLTNKETYLKSHLENKENNKTEHKILNKETIICKPQGINNNKEITNKDLQTNPSTKENPFQIIKADIIVEKIKEQADYQIKHKIDKTNDDYKTMFGISNLKKMNITQDQLNNNVGINDIKHFTFKGDEVQNIINSNIQSKIYNNNQKKKKEKEINLKKNNTIKNETINFQKINHNQQQKQFSLNLLDISYKNDDIDNSISLKKYRRNSINPSIFSKYKNSKNEMLLSYNSKHLHSKQEYSSSDLTAKMMQSEPGEYIDAISIENSKNNIKNSNEDSKYPENCYSDNESLNEQKQTISRRSLKEILIAYNQKSKTTTTLDYAKELTAKAFQLIYKPNKTSQLFEHTEIEDKLDIKSNHQFDHYMKRMKFLSQFYYREGDIIKARIKKKQDILANSKELLNRKFNFDLIPIYSLPKDTSFPYENILNHYANQIQETDIKLMRNKLKKSINLHSIIFSKPISNPQYLMRSYFDLYDALLNYWTDNSLNDSSIFSIVKKSFSKATLLSNFTNVSKYNIILRKTHHNARTFENNTSPQNNNYIFSLITQNISGISKTDHIDTNTTYIPFILQNQKNEKNKKREIRRHVSKRKCKNVTALNAISEYLKQSQGGKKSNKLSEIEQEVINTNPLKNPTFFDLPFRKKQMKKKEISKIFFQQQKSYQCQTKLKNDYLNLKNTGLVEAFSFKEANSLLQKMIKKKSEKKIIFELISSNKSNVFREVQHALKLHEYINSPDETGNTLIMYSTKHSNFEITKFLLDNGSDVNYANKQKDTPLHLALGNKNYKLASLLIEKGANENAVNCNGSTPWSCIDNGL